MERLLLQKTLSDILGCPDRGEKCRVYFQPPASKEMIYDCIVYERSRIEPTFADNQPYALHDRYQVTVIYRNPDSEIPSKIALLPVYSGIQRSSTLPVSPWRFLATMHSAILRFSESSL